jgi:hypothetical protein
MKNQTKCGCTYRDTDEVKKLYKFKYEADEAIANALKYRNKILNKYYCEEGVGWHLTSNLNPW